MPYAIRYPTKPLMFGIFMLLQTLLFIPVVIIFPFRGDAHTFVISSVAMPNIYIAAAITLIAVVVFLCISHEEPASFVIPFSFAIFTAILSMVFHIVTLFRPFEALPYEWDEYLEFVLRGYSIPMVVVTAAIVSGIKIFRKIRKGK
jgi:hypothetical protein